MPVTKALGDLELLEYQQASLNSILFDLNKARSTTRGCQRQQWYQTYSCYTRNHLLTSGLLPIVTVGIFNRTDSCRSHVVHEASSLYSGLLTVVEFGAFSPRVVVQPELEILQ